MGGDVKQLSNKCWHLVVPPSTSDVAGLNIALGLCHFLLWSKDYMMKSCCILLPEVRVKASIKATRVGVSVCAVIYSFLNGPFPASFSLLSSLLYNKKLFFVKNASHWIRTRALQLQKQPVCQLCHHHCPNLITVGLPIYRTVQITISRLRLVVFAKRSGNYMTLA